MPDRLRITSSVQDLRYLHECGRPSSFPLRSQGSETKKPLGIEIGWTTLPRLGQIAVIPEVNAFELHRAAEPNNHHVVPGPATPVLGQLLICAAANLLVHFLAVRLWYLTSGEG